MTFQTARASLSSQGLIPPRPSENGPSWVSLQHLREIWKLTTWLDDDLYLFEGNWDWTGIRWRWRRTTLGRTLGGGRSRGGVESQEREK